MQGAAKNPHRQDCHVLDACWVRPEGCRRIADGVQQHNGAIRLAEGGPGAVRGSASCGLQAAGGQFVRLCRGGFVSIEEAELAPALHALVAQALHADALPLQSTPLALLAGCQRLDRFYPGTQNTWAAIGTKTSQLVGKMPGFQLCRSHMSQDAWGVLTDLNLKNKYVQLQGRQHCVPSLGESWNCTYQGYTDAVMQLNC